jgi:hypothetical protein
MALRDHFISDLLANQYNTDDFAQTVEYEPLTGFKKNIPAIVSAYKGDEYRGADAYGQTKTIKIIGDETYGIVLPVHDDRIRTGDIEYRVQDAIPINDGLEWEITVGKVEV